MESVCYEESFDQYYIKATTYKLHCIINNDSCVRGVFEAICCAIVTVGSITESLGSITESPIHGDDLNHILSYCLTCVDEGSEGNSRSKVGIEGGASMKP